MRRDRSRDHDGVAAQSQHHLISGRTETEGGDHRSARTHYCGAYWRYGFHEDGVVSAQTALGQFAEDFARAQLPLPRVG